jgi:hypothetical protein
MSKSLGPTRGAPATPGAAQLSTGPSLRSSYRACSTAAASVSQEPTVLQVLNPASERGGGGGGGGGTAAGGAAKSACGAAPWAAPGVAAVGGATAAEPLSHCAAAATSANRAGLQKRVDRIESKSGSGSAI